MRYKRLAVALLSTFPLLAAAQTNVTIYGIMDAAISSADNGAEGHNTMVISGHQSGSRIGFRGTEELGFGMKALFNVEAGIALDTGVADAALFQRRSVVGLQNQFGTLTIGREYSPISNVGLASDILNQGFYGNQLSAFNPNRLSRRVSNAVNFKSVPFSGFTGSLMYGAGEQPTGPSGDLNGASVEYANGPIYVGLGFHTLKRQPGNLDKEYGLGLGYKFGDLEVRGNYLALDPAGPNNKFQQYNVGAAMTVGPSKFFLNLQQNKLQRDARGTAFTVAYTYALSKRTNLNASFAKMYNNSLATFGLNAGTPQVNPPANAPGVDPDAFAFGIRHTF